MYLAEDGVPVPYHFNPSKCERAVWRIRYFQWQALNASCYAAAVAITQVLIVGCTILLNNQA